MKNLLLITISLLLSQMSYGQKENKTLDDYLPIDSIAGKYSINKIVHLDSLRESDIEKKATMFTKTDKEKFFITNGQRNQGWSAFAGVKKSQDKGDVNEAKRDIGFDSYDNETKTLLAHALFRNEGSTMGCIKLMIIKCDIIIQFKDGKTRISITNFSYRHYNISTGEEQPIYGSDRGDCKSKATLEELSRCNHCENRKEEIFKFVNKSSMDIIKQYEEYMISKSSVLKSDW